MDIWQGKTVRLRAVRADDGDFLFDLTGDADTIGHLSWQRPPRSPQAARKEAEDLATKPIEHDAFTMVVEDRDGKPVGTIMSHSCDARVGKFSYGVCIHRDHRRKGYARQAVQMLLRYFFDHLRYQKANAGVFSYNTASKAFQEAMGFVQEGCIRRNCFYDGRHHDLLNFGMTVEEFRQRYGTSD